MTDFDKLATCNPRFSAAGSPDEVAGGIRNVVSRTRVVTLTLNIPIYAGKRHTTLRRQDLEEYWSEHGKRGTWLLRGFQKVDNVEVEV